MTQKYEGRPVEFAVSDLEPVDQSVEKDIQRDMAALRRDMAVRGIKLSVPNGTPHDIELLAQDKPIGNNGNVLEDALTMGQLRRFFIRTTFSLI